MKKLLAALFVLAVAAHAGIEVLGIEVLQDGVEVEVRCTQCPAGSTAEYVRVVDGAEVILDTAAVNPATGYACLEVSGVQTGDFVRVVGPDGATLFVTSVE